MGLQAGEAQVEELCFAAGELCWILEYSTQQIGELNAQADERDRHVGNWEP